MSTIPIIDGRIRTIGPTGLRNLSGKTLKNLDEMLIITDTHDNPLAVIFPYSQYMDLQKELLDGREALAHVTAAVATIAAGDIVDDMVAPENIVQAGVVKGMPYVIERLEPAVYQGPPLAERREVPRSGSTENMEVSAPPSALKPLCAHCKEPSATSPCGRCFTMGHRVQPERCMKCTEEREAQRRAAEDSTGADSDDVDRIAFDKEVS